MAVARPGAVAVEAVAVDGSWKYDRASHRAVALVSNSHESRPIQPDIHQCDWRRCIVDAVRTPRSLPENREPTVEKPFWPIFPLIFVKYE